MKYCLLMLRELELCGWKVVEINEHDNEQILDALQLRDDKPILIIAYTKRKRCFIYGK